MNRGIPQLATAPPARFHPALDALRWYFAPEYLHLERADKRRPTLFVGNHSTYGVLDVVLFQDGLYRERGIVLRSLADRNHFKVPLWRDFVVRTGAVLGTRGLLLQESPKNRSSRRPRCDFSREIAAADGG